MTEPTVAEASQAPSPGDPAADSPKTEAQAEQAGVTGTPVPSEEQLEQYRKDQEQRVADPNKVVAREANPNFGGESFAYGQPEK